MHTVLQTKMQTKGMTLKSEKTTYSWHLRTSYDLQLLVFFKRLAIPDSKFHMAHMGPTWVLSAPGRPSCGPHEPCYQGSRINMGPPFLYVEVFMFTSNHVFMFPLSHVFMSQSNHVFMFPSNYVFMFPSNHIVAFQTPALNNQYLIIHHKLQQPS